jgi:hypothetical protein
MPTAGTVDVELAVDEGGVPALLLPPELASDDEDAGVVKTGVVVMSLGFGAAKATSTAGYCAGAVEVGTGAMTTSMAPARINGPRANVMVVWSAERTPTTRVVRGPNVGRSDHVPAVAGDQLPVAGYAAMDAVPAAWYDAM